MRDSLVVFCAGTDEDEMQSAHGGQCKIIVDKSMKSITRAKADSCQKNSMTIINKIVVMV